MSKLKLNKINFDDDDFLVGIKDDKIEKLEEIEEEKSEQELIEIQKKEEFEIQIKQRIDEAELVLNRARDEAQKLVDEARSEALELKNKTTKEIDDLKEEIINKAQQEAQEIIEKAKENSLKENELLINNSKEEIEKERVEITTQGYKDGYKDGLEKIHEELEEKLQDFDNFFKSKYEIKEKILKVANKDIINLITNISKKILLKEINGEVLSKIIKNATSLLEQKENVNIILSQKYAKLLFEFQKKSLNEEIDFSFEDFKQYDNFNILFNPELNDDTIIVENLKERLDASIQTQLDVIIRNIYENSQNGKLDLEEYLEQNELE